MNDVMKWAVLIFLLACLLAMATAKADDARTNRLYARAHLVDAQASARQDTLAAMMPYTIVGVAVIGGVIAVVALVAGVVAVVAIWSERSSQAEPPKVIERQVIIVLQLGQTRRDFWRQASEVKFLDGGSPTLD